jgi:hypothetical protein
VLPRLWPAVGFCRLLSRAGLTGLFAFVPWPLQSLLLAATITARAVAVNGFADFAWPRSLDAARRLERDSGLSIAPFPNAMTCWWAMILSPRSCGRLHKARGLAGQIPLRLAQDRHRQPRPARPALVSADRLARLGLGAQRYRRALISAFDSGAGAAAIDAWVDPPPYTGCR